MKPEVVTISEPTAWKRWNAADPDSRYVIGGELALKGGDGRMTIMKFRGVKKEKAAMTVFVKTLRVR